jgi:hypothetical protein
VPKKKQNFQSFQSSKGGRFIPIYFDMVCSKAWEILSGNSFKLYVYMLSKYKVKYINGQIDYCNKDNISITRSEYSKFMAKNTFERCIDELIDHGFIRVNEYKSMGGSRKLIIYAFNDEWQKYGTEEFNIKNDWKRAKNRDYV